MLDDIARCADGPNRCPLAEQCARTTPTTIPYTVHAYFWFAVSENEQCLNFISKEILK